MPVMIILHKIDALAHDRMHHDPNRLTLTGHGPRLIQGRYHLIHIVAIHLKRTPAKRIKFCVNILQVHHRLSCPIDLLTVPVHCRDQIVYAFGAREHDPLPILPLIQLPITMKRVYNILIVIEFLTERRTDRNTHPLTQRTAGNTDAWQMLMRSRMTLQPGIDLAESRKLFDVKITGPRKRSIKNRRNMTVR